MRQAHERASAWAIQHEQVVHGHGPAGGGRLGLGYVVAPIERGLGRVGCPVDANNVLGEQVHIP